VICSHCNQSITDFNHSCPQLVEYWRGATRCDVCHGTGAHLGPSFGMCEKCKGSGKLPRPALDKGLEDDLERSVESVKSLHRAVQESLPIDKRVPFSQFLRRLAEAEEEKERTKKGGFFVSGF
jgi:hypothetical protein